MQNVKISVEVNGPIHFKLLNMKETAKNVDTCSLTLEFNKSQQVVWKKIHAWRAKRLRLSANATFVNTALPLAAS